MSTQMLLYQKNMQQSICPYSIPQSVLSSKTWKKRRFGLFSVQFSRPLIWCFESKFQDSKFNNQLTPQLSKTPAWKNVSWNHFAEVPFLTKTRPFPQGEKNGFGPLGGLCLVHVRTWSSVRPAQIQCPTPPLRQLQHPPIFMVRQPGSCWGFIKF